MWKVYIASILIRFPTAYPFQRTYAVLCIDFLIWKISKSERTYPLLSLKDKLALWKYIARVCVMLITSAVKQEALCII